MERILKESLKITILGANSSGKTALTVRFLTGKFIFEYASGHDIVYQHDFFISSTKVPLEIVDTSRNENLADVIDGSDGLVIAYAIDNDQSFEHAKNILSDIQEKNFKVLRSTALVGTKTDLWPYKTVEEADGRTIADKYHCNYFELSALSCRDGVIELFDFVVKSAAEKIKQRSVSLPENRCIFRSLQDENENKRSASLQLSKKDVGMKTKTFLKRGSQKKNLLLGGKQNEKNKDNNNNNNHKKVYNTISQIVGSSMDIMQKSCIGETEDHQGTTKRTTTNHDEPVSLHKALCSMNFAFSAIAMPVET